VVNRLGHPDRPAVATAQNGQAVQTYITQSSRGTWLFAPNPNGDGTNN